MRPAKKELRRAKRVPKRQGAWIALGPSATRIPCTLWDISEHGARLAVPRPKSLPPTFVLLLTHDGAAQRHCRIAWRSPTQVGVEFVAADAAEPIVRSWRPPPRGERPVPAAKQSAPVKPDASEVLLPWAGAQAERRKKREPGRVSPARFALATGAVGFLGLQLYYGDGAQHLLAAQFCERATILCGHPELAGIAALLLVLAVLAMAKTKTE